MTAKELMKVVIEKQPEDATYDEIMRELTFAKMIERGLGDSENNRVVSDDEVKKRILEWQK